MAATRTPATSRAGRTTSTARPAAAPAATATTRTTTTKAVAKKATPAQAVKTAKDRQVSAICLIGHTDKLGDKAYNQKLSRARAQAVAAEMIRDGYPAKDITIVADPEAFGNMSFGNDNASEIDRKVTIFYAR